MTPDERIRIVLEGGKPDRVPIFPVYDRGYILRSIGRDEREFVTASAAERIEFMEAGFLRHEVDGFLLHAGTNDRWVSNHTVEKLDDYWLITDTQTGLKRRLLPDGCWAEADGTPIAMTESAGGVSRIQSPEDIDKHVSPPQTERDVEASGYFGPLRHLAGKYPDHHFSFQLLSPMPAAMSACGGYVEGLTTLGSDRELFKRIQAGCVGECCARIGQGKKAGARSVWFTSYHTGADTISPRDYAEVVFPYELEVCRAARAAGLYVFDWYLGDLMPMLDKVMELPLDALVLEQGRKGYDTDPVEIRGRVGPDFCLFGFGFENDYCTFNREGLSKELARQLRGAGADGAFVVGTPIIPPNARCEAVDFYFDEARRLGTY